MTSRFSRSKAQHRGIASREFIGESFWEFCKYPRASRFSRGLMMNHRLSIINERSITFPRCLRFLFILWSLRLRERKKDREK